MTRRNEDPRRDLCAQIHDDDGMNPRLERKDQSSRNTTRKDQQLCKQIAAAINATLQQAASPLLRELTVSHAEPAPDASRVRVVVAGPAIEQAGAAAVLEELRHARGFLRLSVGDSIARKRVPELIFAISSGEEDTDDA